MYDEQEIEIIKQIIEQLKRDFPTRSMRRIIQDAERIYINRKTHHQINTSGICYFKGKGGKILHPEGACGRIV